jgi:outer membrane protein OmpA-like peptidoglycan-associated protein
MRLKNWLLAGTGLAMLAFTSTPAFAQSNDIITTYEAYIAARNSGDANALATAEAQFQSLCDQLSFALEDCITAVEAGMFGPVDTSQAAPRAQPAPVEPAPVVEPVPEPAPVEPAPVAQPQEAQPPATDPMTDLGAALLTQVQIYGAAAAAAEAGDQNALQQAQAAQAEIDRLCVDAGYHDRNQCLAAFGYAIGPINVPAQPVAPQAPVEQPQQPQVQPQQPAQPDPMAELQNQLNIELGNYQSAMDLAAAGNLPAAQDMAAAAQSNILALCQNAGYSSIEACIGQSLPPLPQPQVEPQPQQPQPEPQPQPQPQQPVSDFQQELEEEVQIYGAALAAVETGDTTQYRVAQRSYTRIQRICDREGFGSVDDCLASINVGIQPLPPEPTAQPQQPQQPIESPVITEGPGTPIPEQPAVAIPEDLLDQDVNPDAVETLPADILPQEAAPLLDSIKDALGIGDQPIEMPAQPAAPPPTSDADAQAFAPVEQPPVSAETGQAIDAPVQLGIQQQAPGTTVTRQETGGFVVQLNSGLYFDNPEQERDRIYDQGEDEIFYEQLSRGRVKETIVRADGSQIVTIRDRDGDILRRSRITPSGREYILADYDDEDGNFTEYEDPGDSLPPLVLNIPARDYVLDADDADDAEVADFLYQPPVEQVRRLYSIEEVKRSARIRDSVRRLEIGGLTFDSGKATISRSQVSALTNVANAMLELLDRNPGETFLIEGHTDAVGTEIFNLSLSDLRASTIARILTDFYGIPPENLVTQGYGEENLKVDTAAAERENRRVAVRRITPLITLAAN